MLETDLLIHTLKLSEVIAGWKCAEGFITTIQTVRSVVTRQTVGYTLPLRPTQERRRKGGDSQRDGA